MTRRTLLALGLAATGAAAGSPTPAAQTPRTLAERLGYRREDRLLMLHADDVGMCHSVNVATARAFAAGLVSCGSAMVPCPWFPEIAAWSQEHPEWDLGYHLTLTSEWRQYRWGPTAPQEKVSSLLDPDGFLFRSVEDVVKHATPEHVEIEIRAQVARGGHFKMKPTHVDSHMGTLFSDPRYFEVYTRVAKEVGLLPMLMEPEPGINRLAQEMGLDYPPLAEKLRGQGFVLLDKLITGAKASGYEARKAEFHQMIRDLKPGVTEIILHLAGDDDEIRHVTGNWANRWHETRIFTDADTKALIAEEKIKLIGYRQLAALWARPGG